MKITDVPMSAAQRLPPVTRIRTTLNFSTFILGLVLHFNGDGECVPQLVHCIGAKINAGDGAFASCGSVAAWLPVDTFVNKPIRRHLQHCKITSILHSDSPLNIRTTLACLQSVPYLPVIYSDNYVAYFLNSEHYIHVKFRYVTRPHKRSI